MTLPEDCQPRAPRPSDARIEAAAREICEVMASDTYGRPRDPKSTVPQCEQERVVDLRDACSGFPKFRQENPIATDDYRWAVQLLVEAGLLVLKSTATEFVPEKMGKIFLWTAAVESTLQYSLVSTPCMWTKWRTEGPILGPCSRIRCDRSDRSVWLDGNRIVGELDEDVFDYLAVLVASYPNRIPYEEIQKRAPSLTENQSRFNSKVDKLHYSFSSRIEVDRKTGKGHVLKLPLD